MSLQWTLVAGVLYLEIFIVLLLSLPIFSPSRWNQILHSNFMKSLTNQTAWYFYLIIFVLILFLLDAVREMRKYSNPDHSELVHLNTEIQNNMRLFRAQRNFYISGFALFLSFVIRRLLYLMTIQASLIAKSEAALKQAQGASAAVRNILNFNTAGEKEQNASNEARDKEIEELKTARQLLEEELGKANNDNKAIKSQVESVTKEYDRLLDEYRKLQVAGSADKKKE